MDRDTSSQAECKQAVSQRRTSEMVRLVAGATTGMIIGGALAGFGGAALCGFTGLLIGFSATEDERRIEG